MTARLARIDDIENLVEMGGRFHAMSPHKTMGRFDPQAMANVIKFMIESTSCAVFTNGNGVIGGTLSPVYFNPSIWQMEENFWWASKDGQELLTALEDFARERGASFLLMSTLENEKSQIVGRLMARKGYEPVEKRYVKELR